MKTNRGVSLIEILVVLGIFGVLSVLSTRTITLSLSGSKKSMATLAVRENLNYSLSVIERQLRNATAVSSCLETSSSLTYHDQDNVITSFSCQGGYIASGSARLTSNEIVITACSFECVSSESGAPPIVTVNLAAKNSQVSSAKEEVPVTTSVKILLRNY